MLATDVTTVPTLVPTTLAPAKVAYSAAEATAADSVIRARSKLPISTITASIPNIIGAQIANSNAAVPARRRRKDCQRELILPMRYITNFVPPGPDVVLLGPSQLTPNAAQPAFETDAPPVTLIE